MNIGDSVWQAMLQNGDTALHDSMFHNSSFHVEWGFGTKNDYFATDAFGTWQVSVKPRVSNDVAQPIDKRGQLPVRVGATPYPKRPLAGIQLYVCHYTAGPSSQKVEQVAQYQVGANAQLPFPSIAYAFFVEKDGSLYWCQDLDRRTWGSDGIYQGKVVNDIGIHACYAGDLAPNPAQIAALHAGRVFCENILGHALTVRGHSDDGATQCPGPQLAQWRSQI